MCLYCNAIPYKILIPHEIQNFSKFIRHLSLKIANILHAGHNMWHWVTCNIHCVSNKIQFEEVTCYSSYIDLSEFLKCY